MRPPSKADTSPVAALSPGHMSVKPRSGLTIPVYAANLPAAFAVCVAIASISAGDRQS